MDLSLTIWKRAGWMLESAMWGNFFNLVVRPDEWSRLQSAKPWLASLEPPPTSLPFRKEDERVRRGWSLSRPMRWISAMVAAAVVGVGVPLDQGLGGIWAGLAAGAVVYLELPGRDAGPMHRFIARARFPSDPRFERRLERTLGLGVTGALLGAFAIPFALIVADPGSGWRLAFGGWPSLGGSSRSMPSE